MTVLPLPLRAPRVLPPDLFSLIVGHERIKRRIRAALTAPDPFFILLIGGPGTGKSMFLEDLERLPGSHVMIGDGFSRYGLERLLLENEHPPDLLLIDELEKVHSEAGQGGLDALLNPTEGGLIARDKGDWSAQKRVRVSVLAAANEALSPTGRYLLSPALLSRAYKIILRDYTLAERLAVIAGYLMARQHLTPDHAHAIAALVAPRSADVRQARHIANLYDGDMRNVPEMIAELDAWETAVTDRNPPRKRPRRRRVRG